MKDVERGGKSYMHSKCGRLFMLSQIEPDSSKISQIASNLNLIVAHPSYAKASPINHNSSTVGEAEHDG